MQQPESIPPLPPRVVAIGTSAGGLEALTELLRPLPELFPFPLLVVQHLSPDHRSRLPALLARHTRLPVSQARPGEAIVPGRVYVAPPGRHMEIDALARIRFSEEPPVHHSRPSVDVLFDSLAHAFGPRGVAVVLTGAGTDGALGARAVHDAGGLVIAQDRPSSRNFGMPSAVIAAGVVDHVLGLSEIGRFLDGLEPDPRIPH